MENKETTNPYSKFSGRKLYALGKEASEAGNSEEAKKFYQLAAEKGNADAMYALFLAYFNIDDVVQGGNNEIANEWLIKAAQKGNVKAMSSLAAYLGGGLGFRYNPWESTKWYLKAAKKGDVDSMEAVGFNYLFGVGTRPNEVKGLEWLKKAADQGSKEAIKQLARFYLECTDDAERTEYWVQKAKKAKIKL